MENRSTVATLHLVIIWSLAGHQRLPEHAAQGAFYAVYGKIVNKILTKTAKSGEKWRKCEGETQN
jgi:hypothetical protein